MKPSHYRELAMQLFDEDDESIIQHFEKRREGFTISTYQNGWHLELYHHPVLLNMAKTSGCIPVDEIFDLIDEEDLRLSLLKKACVEEERAHNTIREMKRCRMMLA